MIRKLLIVPAAVAALALPASAAATHEPQPGPICCVATLEPPDLVVSSVKPDSFTIRNVGLGPTPAGVWFRVQVLRLYGNAVLISTLSLPPLGPSFLQSSTYTYNFGIGSRYLCSDWTRVIADWPNPGVVAEQNENNNAYIANSPGPTGC